jgi:uncharacterized protein (DUF427 family)
MRAVCNGVVIAESSDSVVVEGNHYFPSESVRTGHLTASSTRTLCPWKGLARYWTVTVGTVRLPDAAWSYARPTPLARRVKGRIAFWQGVVVEPVLEQHGSGFDAS